MDVDGLHTITMIYCTMYGNSGVTGTGGAWERGVDSLSRTGDAGMAVYGDERGQGQPLPQQQSHPRNGASIHAALRGVQQLSSSARDGAIKARMDEIAASRERWMRQRELRHIEQSLAADDKARDATYGTVGGFDGDKSYAMGINSPGMRQRDSEELGHQHSGAGPTPTSAAGGAHAPSDASVRAEVLERVMDSYAERVEQHVRADILSEQRQRVASQRRRDESLESTLAEELRGQACPICMELMHGAMHEPFILVPCSHTFCKSCLDAIEAEYRRDKIVCPVCRSAVKSQVRNTQLLNVIRTFVEKEERNRKREIEEAAARRRRAADGHGSGERDTSTTGGSINVTASKPSDRGGEWEGGHGADGSGAHKQEDDEVACVLRSIDENVADPDDAKKSKEYFRAMRHVSMRREILCEEQKKLSDEVQEADRKMCVADESLDILRTERVRILERLERARHELKAVDESLGSVATTRNQSQKASVDAASRLRVVDDLVSSLDQEIAKHELLLHELAPGSLEAMGIAYRL